jgi:hypothetical protein
MFKVNFVVFLIIAVMAVIKGSLAAPAKAQIPQLHAKCDNGMEYSEMFIMCYPLCKPGYSGKGPMVC